MPEKLKIWLALITVYITWSGTYLGMRFAVETIPPFLMAGTRFLISGALLYTWRRLAGDPAPTRRQWVQAGVVGLLLLLGGNGLVSLAEKTLASGIAALLIGSAPLWMTLIEGLHPRGTRPKALGVLGLVIGFGGIILLVAPSLSGKVVAGVPPLGVILVLCAALFWSFGSIFNRHANLPSSSLLSTGMEMLTGGVGLYLAGTLTGEWGLVHLGQVSTRSWLGLLYLIVFGALAGFTCYAWLLRNAPVSLVATYAYVNPVMAVLLGGLLAGEVLSLHVLVSALIIVGSILLINLSRRREHQAAAIAAGK
jgi:drug/metabolite transporter (DMT)-like permease